MYEVNPNLDWLNSITENEIPSPYPRLAVFLCSGLRRGLCVSLTIKIAASDDPPNLGSHNGKANAFSNLVLSPYVSVTAVTGIFLKR